MSVFLIIVIFASLLTLALAAFNFFSVKRLDEGTDKMKQIAAAIRLGANTFIRYEYKILLFVVIIVAVILSIVISPSAAFSFGTNTFFIPLLSAVIAIASTPPV